MVQVKKTISCSDDRSCVVVLEPSGAEFLLRAGRVMEISGELQEGEEIEVEEQGNCYVVHVPSGDVSLFIAGARVAPPTSLVDIVHLELAKLPLGEEDIPFAKVLLAQTETFDELERRSLVSSAGKLAVFEIAAETSMELFTLRPQSTAHANFVAAVCRRVLAAGAILVQTSTAVFASGLWAAAKSDLHLGTEPKSIRRMLASSCLYPKSMADAVSRWANSQDSQSLSPQKKQSDVAEN